MTDADADWEALLSATGCSAQEMGALPPQLVEEGIASLGLPLPRKARLHLRFAPRTNEVELLRHELERQEQRVLEPWRLDFQRFASERAQVEKSTQASLESWFVDLAKQSSLTMMEVMIGTYTIFGTEKSIKQFANLILAKRGERRIKAHNAYVAQTLGEAWVASHGERALQCPFPLFPPLPQFTALQEQLLLESEECRGGGRRRRSTMFRDEVDGGGYLPVVQVGNEGLAVDVSVVENAVARIFAALDKNEVDKVEILKAVEALRRKKPNTEHHYPYPCLFLFKNKVMFPGSEKGKPCQVVFFQ
jgi:hypothetical protein